MNEKMIDLGENAGMAGTELFALGKKGKGKKKSIEKFISLLNEEVSNDKQIDAKLNFCLKKCFFRYGFLLGKRLDFMSDYKLFNAYFDLDKELDSLIQRLQRANPSTNPKRIRRLAMFMLSLCQVLLTYFSSNVPHSAENQYNYSKAILGSNRTL